MDKWLNKFLYGNKGKVERSYYLVSGWSMAKNDRLTVNDLFNLQFDSVSRIPSPGRVGCTEGRDSEGR